MDKKLEDYRRKKRRQAIINQLKERFYNMVSFQQVKNTKSDHVIVDADQLNDQNNIRTDNKLKEVIPPQQDDLYFSDTDSVLSSSTIQDMIVSDIDDDDDADDEDGVLRKQKPATDKTNYLKYFTYLIYFLLWSTCYAIAIQLKFGIVYFLFSGLFGVYLNTRTGPKKRNEISAYSVFNKNCEAIDGTLKAEQFEREIGIRMK